MNRLLAGGSDGMKYDEMKLEELHDRLVDIEKDNE
jgi:hypothetical protein